MSVGVSGVSICQWCQYVSVVSACVTGVSISQWCKYVSVVSLGVSGVSMCQWCHHTPIEIFPPKILELLVKNIFVAPGLDCRYTGMLDWLLNNFFNRV